jgi:Calcineurin-like phosphoesterase
MISPSSPRRRRSRRTLIAVSVLGFVALVLVTVSPLRAYVTDAVTTERRSGEPSYVIAAAGDIVCSSQMERQAQVRAERLPSSDTGVPSDSRPASVCSAGGTTDLLHELAPTAVLPLGDLQYECGDAAEFDAYSATWGQFKSVSHPVVGNHEYGSACGRSDASGYFDYWGPAAGEKGWYSWDLGGWHFIALNSQCHSGRGAESVGGCNVGSEQYRWLQADLAAHKNDCTLAYWHEARFTSGRHGPALQMADIWNELVASRVDVVLSAHNHVYERFDFIGHTDPPTDTGQNPDSIIETPNLDRHGIQQFVVGTGGRNHVRFTKPPLVGEVVRDDRSFGVLSMRLHSGSYDWEFVPVQGSTLQDRGSAKCR